MEYLKILLNIAVDMGFYMMIGLLLVTVVDIFLKKEAVSKHLGQDGIMSVVKASILGVPLPLCSCGVIPAGMFMKEKGASDGAAVSFLVSTPQTGVDSIAATYGMMGITFAWFRPVAAFISGIFTGMLVKIFSKEKTDEIVDDDHCECCSVKTTPEPESIPRRAWKSLSYTFGEFLSDISIHFVAGVLVAALIMILVPDDFLVELGLGKGIVTMLVMIVIGLPMYICSTSSIPIALSLLAKGISPGAAFVFLFMGPFSNIASLVVLSKKLGRRTMVIYLAGAIISALAFGFLLDFLAPMLPFPDFSSVVEYMDEGTLGIVKMTVAAVFYTFIFRSIYLRIRKKLAN